MMSMNQEENNGAGKCFGKEKDMITMNRLYTGHIISVKTAQLNESNLGFDFTYTFVDKHKREYCISDIDGRK